MLASIESYIDSTNLTEEEILNTKKMPTLFDMIDEIQDNELMYIVGQKIGSHHVHGTWPSIYMHYINIDSSGFYAPRDHDSETHENQYIIISLFVLQAIGAYIKFIISETETKSPVLQLIRDTKNEILKLNGEIIGDDFELLTV